MWYNRLVLIFAFLLVAADLQAQAPRTIRGVSRVEEFRPVGDRRIWTFMSRDSVLGNLASGVEKTIEIDGEPALVLKGGTNLDFGRVGGQAATTLQTEHYVALDGRYLGDRLLFQLPDNRREEFEFTRRGAQLEGYFTRGGEKIQQSVPWPRGYYAYDGNFIDQLEIYLATRDLTQATVIDDSVFVPQLLGIYRVAAEVGAVEWRELWKGKFDSVVLVYFTEPQRMSAFMTLDHRLIRVDFPEQNYRVYQDIVQRVRPGGEAGTTTTPVSPEKNVVTYVALAIQYLAFGIIAALVLLLLAARAFRWPDAYFGLLFGGLVFGLVLVTQIPMQQFVVAKLVIPGLRQGVSFYWLGLLPALLGGLVQECLKLLGIYAVMFHRQPALNRLALLGAFTAGAFGLAEACYLAEPTTLLSWQLFERAARIVFHISSGAILGIALASQMTRRYALIAGMVIANSLIVYLPVFAQRGVFSAQSLHFALAAISLGTLLCSVVMIKTFRPSPQPHPPSDSPVKS